MKKISSFANSKNEFFSRNKKGNPFFGHTNSQNQKVNSLKEKGFDLNFLLKSPFFGFVNWQNQKINSLPQKKKKTRKKIPFLQVQKWILTFIFQGVQFLVFWITSSHKNLLLERTLKKNSIFWTCKKRTPKTISIFWTCKNGARR